MGFFGGIVEIPRFREGVHIARRNYHAQIMHFLPAG